MAGHSHWAGIKHKKGKADKLRSSLFSKLSREITVAAKLGGKDPEMNARLRAAIDNARSSNMPKDNIIRAIDKSENNQNSDFEDIRYEGFGPDKIAVIVEALTDNKNRTASIIRTIFQKNGGNLGTQGSSSHNFKRIGVIKINKEEVTSDKIFEYALEAGAEDCFFNEKNHQIICDPNEVYNIKKQLEQNIKNFISTTVEWLPLNKVEITGEKFETAIRFIDTLEEEDDIQNDFTNLKMEDN